MVIQGKKMLNFYNGITNADCKLAFNATNVQ